MKYGLIAHSFPWLGCMIYHSRANLMLFSEKTKKILKSWSIRLVFAEPVTIIVLVSCLCSAWARFIQWPVTSPISPAPIGRIAFMSRDRQSTTIWHGSKNRRENAYSNCFWYNLDHSVFVKYRYASTSDS